MLACVLIVSACNKTVSKNCAENAQGQYTTQTKPFNKSNATEDKTKLKIKIRVGCFQQLCSEIVEKTMIPSINMFTKPLYYDDTRN